MSNVALQSYRIDRAQREDKLKQSGGVVWFTGLSGAGKSTLADALDVTLHGLGYSTYVLDGDNLRAGLNADLGFSEADRRENIRRAGEVARLMADAGLIVLVALISPYAQERAGARRTMPEGRFIEVYCDCPLEVCKIRDVKGLYARASRGEIQHFTGVSAPYEQPLTPELRLDTSVKSIDQCTAQVIEAMAPWLATR